MQPIGEPRSGAIKHCKDLPVSQSQRKCGAGQEIEEKEDANEVKNKLSLANVTLSPLHVLLEGIVVRIHSRVTKSENFPDSKVFVAKTFRIKRVHCVNFQIRHKRA